MGPVLRWSLLLLLLLAASGARADPQVQRLDAGLLLLDDRPTPPPAGDLGWEPVTLPDVWRERRPGRGGFAWYRFALPGPAAPGETWAVWLPQLNMNAAVFVNGAPIGSGGSFEEPVAHNFNRPLYFAFPSSLLARPENAIDVRLYAIPHHYGALGPLQAGPDRLLRPRHEHRRFLQVGLSQLATVLAFGTVLVIGGFWVGTRFDPVYGYFALAALFWAVTSFNYWVRDVPLPTWAWERVVNGAIEWFVVAFAFWAHRFTGVSRPRLEWALLGFGAGAALLTAALPVAHFYAAVVWLHAASLAIAIYGSWLVLSRLRGFRPWEAAIYVLGGVLCLGFGIHDLALQLGWRDAQGPFLLAYMLPVMLLAFGTTLARRFLAALGESERLNRELEERVQQKHAELEQSYRRLGELERARVLAGERERIMREMHDGLGGRLVSTLSMVELGRGSPAEVAASLRAALDDMRLVIDSLDPHVGDLSELLGMLRARLDPLLRRSGLAVEWRVGDLPELACYGPEEYLHVLRIVQEALTNVVKHAAARRVTLETRLMDGPEPAVAIEVRDDGGGLRADPASAGRGLGNMRDRAARLGGELSVDAAAPGTRVLLRLPLGGPTPGS